MGRPIAIGAYRGEVLADREGLFFVVRLESPCPPETLRAGVARVGFRGVVLSGPEAFLFGPGFTLKTTWSPEWLEGLLRMLEGADPVRAWEVAERVFLRRIFARGLEGWLELEDGLRVLKAHAQMAQDRAFRYGAFEEARVWGAWVWELEDIEARLRNLHLSLGRFAVRLGGGRLERAYPRRSPGASTEE
ncbi:hypothetical protein [Thermus scotoductus]|uniref:Uncharacterized protein n=1 Tax=Thermus scotoductus TaxID=37636 RepID=A0A430RUI7_THESC|nr:hypothetical protein [Thermus scotoductus]RTH23375.1 hypothetical protein CSW38_10850 [Thermus scotoductus]